MSLSGAAEAASLFPSAVRSTLLAISGSEAGWDLTARGDPVSALPPTLCGVPTASYSCGGYTSFGPWQVNLPCNRAVISALSGIRESDPCAQAAWLTASYANSARAALAVYRSQGLDAWTTYRTGAYLAYLSRAQTALSDIPTDLTPVTSKGPLGIAAVVGGSLLVVAGGTTIALLADPALRAEASTSIRRLWS